MVDLESSLGAPSEPPSGAACACAWLRAGLGVTWRASRAEEGLTLHPTAAGRTYAAYGGVHVAVALLWLWLVDKQQPDRWDLIGGATHASRVGGNRDRLPLRGCAGDRTTLRAASR